MDNILMDCIAFKLKNLKVDNQIHTGAAMWLHLLSNCKPLLYFYLD